MLVKKRTINFVIFESCSKAGDTESDKIKIRPAMFFIPESTVDSYT